MSLLDELAAVLEARKQESPDTSYVASLYQGGTNRILQKIGEESAELMIAGKDNCATYGLQNNQSREEVVKETADLWFHCMVLLAHQGLSHTDVIEELAARFGISGHEEKAGRSP
ncbi:MAG: phosphoribosyl-ATP diphosphatase [bacterium]